MSIRRYLSWLVMLWLGCQSATMFAAPFAACVQHTHEQAAPGDPACPLHQHHAPANRDGAALRCQCQLQDGALAALIIGTGIIPASISISDNDAARAVGAIEPLALSHIELPDTQPPR